MKKIAVIGLGYVGLPLAVEFGKYRPVIGFDLNQARVDELEGGHDSTLETTDQDLVDAKFLEYSTNINDLKDAQIYIVAVPTPTDKNKRPDLGPLIGASTTVAKVMSKGDIVVYESTVYPGATEEDCVPVLEKVSGMKYNKDFFVGYSPERINPGDKVNTLTTIKKVTSGSTPEIGKEVDKLYSDIIKAGTHLAPTIKVAEASKVIENSQRDINIAFVNELAVIFSKMGIDTLDVLEAAGTKWNFLPFRPGLVGGHCIGVDPFYLAQKAQEVGYYPEIILAGRRLNDSMGFRVAADTVKLMINKGHTIKDSKVLVLGITFKENCPDIRNTRAIDVVEEMTSFGCDVEVFDPWASKEEVKHEYNINLIDNPEYDNYSAIILAVSHNEFKKIDFSKCKANNQVLYDIKSILPKEFVDKRL
jgi:UDP-N-acetyl-D-galactosamine dehydrogenase